MEVIVILAILGTIVFLAIRNRKRDQQRANNPQSNSKQITSGAKDEFPALHIEGLGLPVNTPCKLYRHDDHVTIDTGTQKLVIKYEKLRAAVVKSEREFIELDRSVVGRALVGTLLVPGLGTIVGGMSGLKSRKKKKTYDYFLILNYIDKDGNLSGVTFKNNFNIIKIHKFCDGINKDAAKYKPEITEL